MSLPPGRAYGFAQHAVSWERACPRSIGAGARSMAERGQGRAYGTHRPERGQRRAYGTHRAERGQGRSHGTARSASVHQ